MEKWKNAFAGLGKSVTTSNFNRLHGLIGRLLSQDAFGVHLFDIKYIQVSLTTTF
jgi:hypothetical protein